MEYNNNLIANNIIMHRKKLNISQKSLAKILETSVTTISRIECATEKASINMLLRMASVFDISIDSLISGTIKYNDKRMLIDFDNPIQKNLYNELRTAMINEKISFLDVMNYYIENFINK